ncbi:hypothetical protein MAHJHV54_48930 [Mycobacterium avium subsp. hominissuis]
MPTTKQQAPAKRGGTRTKMLASAAEVMRERGAGQHLGPGAPALGRGLLLGGRHCGIRTPPDAGPGTH